MAWVASLSADDVKRTLKMSPLPFVGSLVTSRDAFAAAAGSRSASEALAAAASSATAAFASSAEAWASQQSPPSPTTTPDATTQHAHGRRGAALHILHKIAHKLKTAEAKHCQVRQNSGRHGTGTAKKDVPPVPDAGLQMGASGPAVIALQSNLALLGFLRCGRKFAERCGKFDHKTADAVWCVAHLPFPACSIVSVRDMAVHSKGSCQGSWEGIAL